jgi:hypothetical protein
MKVELDLDRRRAYRTGAMQDAGFGLPRTKQAKFAEHPFHTLG